MFLNLPCLITPEVGSLNITFWISLFRLRLTFLVNDGSNQLPSMANILPLVIKTRFHSSRALSGLGSVHRRYLLTTRSKLSLSNGRSSASFLKNLIFKFLDFDSFVASLIIACEMSTAVTSCPISARSKAKKPRPVPTSSTLSGSLPIYGERLCFQSSLSSSPRFVAPLA